MSGLVRWRLGSRVALLALVVTIVACEGGEKQSAGDPDRALARPKLSDGGRVITFVEGSPGLQQLQVQALGRERAVVRVAAPARVVATILPAEGGQPPVVLFESPDLTGTWSAYRQTRANANRAALVLARVRRNFADQGAVQREVIEAESDSAQTRAAFIEQTSRLRTFGFDPDELDKVAAPTAWLLADVPEASLREVDRGEAVELVLASFPDRRFRGKADAVGAVVDPTTRTMKVRVAVPNAQGDLRPGMYARAEFGNPIGNAVILPVSAVVVVEDKSFAFVRTAPGVFERRELIVRPAGPTQLVVVRGISAGASVVTSGAMLLKGLSFGY